MICADQPFVLLDDARAYGKAIAAANADKALPRPTHDLTLEALGPVVNGTMPVLIAGTSAANIRDIIAFADSTLVAWRPAEPRSCRLFLVDFLVRMWRLNA